MPRRSLGHSRSVADIHCPADPTRQDQKPAHGRGPSRHLQHNQKDTVLPRRLLERLPGQGPGVGIFSKTKWQREGVFLQDNKIMWRDPVTLGLYCLVKGPDYKTCNKFLYGALFNAIKSMKKLNDYHAIITDMHRQNSIRGIEKKLKDINQKIAEQRSLLDEARTKTHLVPENRPINLFILTDKISSIVKNNSGEATKEDIETVQGILKEVGLRAKIWDRDHQNRTTIEENPNNNGTSILTRKLRSLVISNDADKYKNMRPHYSEFWRCAVEEARLLRALLHRRIYNTYRTGSRLPVNIP